METIPDFSAAMTINLNKWHNSHYINISVDKSKKIINCIDRENKLEKHEYMEITRLTYVKNN